jgi:hypothetical protein
LIEALARQLEWHLVVAGFGVQAPAQVAVELVSVEVPEPAGYALEQEPWGLVDL